jgi:hypothetical protein
MNTTKKKMKVKRTLKMRKTMIKKSLKRKRRTS